MSSWYTTYTDLIKKKICRFLLQRYLGKYLEKNLIIDQLNIDLYNGKGTVYNVALDSEALNDLCANQGWGIEVISGHIGSVTVTVPWNALMKDDSHVEVEGVCITVRPIARQTSGTSMLESMWSSISSSMQLAQDCLEEEENEIEFNAQTTTIDGLENFALTIDNVLNRIKIKCKNTQIRLEHYLPDIERGIALIVKINLLEYENEASDDPSSAKTTEENDEEIHEKSHLLSTYASHHLALNEITFYTEEFRIANPSNTTKLEQVVATQQFYNISSSSSSSQLPTEETKDELLTENILDSDNISTNSFDTNNDNREQQNIRSSDKIMICKILGKQDIRIKLKQFDNCYGPKVHLDLTFGAMYFFISPRQIHLLNTFSDAFINNNHLNDIKKSNSKQTIQQRSRETDIIHNNQFNSMSGVLGHEGFWSNPIDDIIKPIDKERFSSKATEYTESVDTSMATSTTAFSPRSHDKNIDNNGGQISHFALNIATTDILLLHEDVIFENSLSSDSPLSDESVNMLIQMSENFFDNVVNDKISDEVRQKNHLRLKASPIIVDGEEQRNSNTNVTKFTMSIGRVEFDEVLGSIPNAVIKFCRQKPNDYNNLHGRPDVYLNFKQITSIRKGSKFKRHSPKTEFHILLEACLIDFDITLYDRLNAILSTSPFSYGKRMEGLNTPSKHNDAVIEFSIESLSIDFQLRFPINDSRPLHDPDRVPWWKQNIRPDFLLFSFSQFRFKYALPSSIEVFANEINIYYCENLKTPKIHLAKTILVEKNRSGFYEADIDYPRVSINILTDKAVNHIIKFNLDDSDSGETSGESCPLYSNRKRVISPFSAKKVCRESDTPHPIDDPNDTDCIIIPGDTEETKKFCENAMKTSKIQIQISLPVVSLQINSKHIYEIIYNRINTDLLLWTPSSTAPTIKQHKPNMEASLLNASMMGSIYIPSTSTPINDDFDNSTDNSDSDSDDNVYYSAYDKPNQKKQQNIVQAPTACSFELNVGDGIVTLYSPVRGADKNVVPGQLGEFIIKTKSFHLLSASGFNGNSGLAYVCLQAKSAELYHCGLIPNPTFDAPLRLIHNDIPDYMFSTIYPKPDNLTLSNLKRSQKREMLSLAIQITTVPEKRVKRIRLTTGLQYTTLKHNPAEASHTWLNQLIDMLDVVDYPVEGYIPYAVITEMQLHIWDGSIDYRPLNFPFRAVIDMSNFMIYSNLTTGAWGCNLRFIAEECALCLAPYDPNSETKSSYITALPSKNLVSVLDIGLIELSLRLNEKATTTHPKFDLRASIQDIHLRTCSDSGRALAQLISYIAANGDLIKDDDDSEIIDNKDNEPELVLMKTASTHPEIASKQQERVNRMMAEALQESLQILSESEEEEIICDKGVEVFYFPDETHHIQQGESSKKSNRKSRLITRTQSTYELKSDSSSAQNFDDICSTDSRPESESTDDMQELLNYENSVMAHSFSALAEDEVIEASPQVKQELGEISGRKPPSGRIKRRQKKYSPDNTDDDFCFIAQEERSVGLAEVEVSGDPIRIVDNHFSTPIGKTDLLKAPDGFPMAVNRLQLCQGQFTWHIYGGNDFPIIEDETNKNSKNSNSRGSQMSEAYEHGVSYSKGQSGVKFGRKNPLKMSWKIRGGPKRNHDVLLEMHIKARLSHEEYPKTTTQASRQVILIKEFEIRDRLQSSEINKLLYHPPPKLLPKKSSKHMVVIKALNIRPDPILMREECCLRISALPIRVNLDQDTLLFIVKFFNELGNDGTNNDDKQLTPSRTPHEPPIMMVHDMPDTLHEFEAKKMVSKSLMLLMDEEEKPQETPEPINEVKSQAPIYFREIIFSPEVLIRLDYHGRRVELSRGPIAGLLMGLGQLQCSEIRLKKIFHKHGILGVERLLNFLFQEWLQDIKRNQLPAILSGVGPMYTILQLLQGIRDLFLLPIEQYQKDGRIVRGLQLGAQSFTSRTALAALELTAKIIEILQLTAETAYDLVTPGGPSVKRCRRNRKDKRKRTNHPQDIREGVANAYHIVKEGINDTANTLYETTAAEHDQKGYTGAVGAVFRQIPPIAVCPIVLVTQATTNVLGGVKNQLIPDARIEAKEKWKDDKD